MKSELRGIAYFESLQYLEGRKFSSLESAALLLEALGNPQEQVRAVHIGGTNGKGSVSALVAGILLSAGASVGQTSSPHLHDVTERCLINGQPVERASFSETIDRVVETARRIGVTPSYFVLGIIGSFLEFAERRLDWMVVEVGLGGLLDATNLISRPHASVITGISADHLEILGPTLEEVARNKAGIAKREVPLFVGRVTPEIEQVIRGEAERRGASVEFTDKDFSYDRIRDEIVFSEMRLPAYLNDLFLPGAYQKENALLAVRVGYALGLPAAAVQAGLRRTRWPGRLELVHDDASGCDVLFDVGHNEEGVRALCEYLRELDRKEIVFVISILSRKSWRNMLSQIKSLTQEMKTKFVFTDSGYPDAVSPEALQNAYGEGVSEIDPAHAFALASKLLENRDDGIVVVTGSVFLVSRLRPTVVQGAFSSFER